MSSGLPRHGIRVIDQLISRGVIDAPGDPKGPA